MRHLRAFIFDHKILAEWTKYLPLVQRIIIDKVHDSAKISPASIITPGIDLDNSLVPTSVNMTGGDLSAYVKSLIEQQQIAIKVARKHLLEDEKNIRIRYVIMVERDTQKWIIIGHKGGALKKVGIQSREDLEKFFGKQIHIELYVKVNKDWRSNAFQLRRFGYNQK
jgi:hypothetical protein